MVSSTPLLDRIKDPADLRQLPPEDLRQLADELRLETISAVSETGGHLGAGLGVVELTVALHHVFNTPDDRIIWDVGHQAYPHKILTQRRDRIRRVGGSLYPIECLNFVAYSCLRSVAKHPKNATFMQTIGERLEEARKRKGISLREAAEVTKIRSDYLGYLEQNKFDFDLPEIYRSGFIKNYARYLKLDPEKILTDYNTQRLGMARNKRAATEWFGTSEARETSDAPAGSPHSPAMAVLCA